MSAVGGSGRSTTCALLACRLASSVTTAVLDIGPRLASPWPSWATQPGGGLLTIPPDQPATRAQVMQAASRYSASDGGSWHGLTDHQDWHCPPLTLPQDPAAWYQLAAIGGWQAVIADTAHPVAHDVVAARTAGRSSITAAWCSLPYSVPVLCAAATSTGIQALQTAVMAASAESLPLQRTIVALVAIGDGRLPASVKAGATMLQPRVASVVHIPYDPHIRNHGMRDATRLKTRSMEAAALLARAVLDAAHATWGEPLPPAPVPAPLGRQAHAQSSAQPAPAEVHAS